MQISDIKSSELLPRFASDIEWVQMAYDIIIKAIKARSLAIDAPLTMASIEALTDSEIEYYFDSIGIIKYYPDIDRNIQNNILYNLFKLQHFAGTPEVVELLCQYIFQDLNLQIKITDNLAFDDNGYPYRPDLLDLFDVDITPSEYVLTADIITRIYANIFSLARNSQTIRDFNINYNSTDIDTTAYISTPFDSVESVLYNTNDEICEYVQPVTLGVFGGDFSGNNISLDSVDGGGSVINRYNPGRSLFPNTGFVEGAMIARHSNSRALFELRGWEPGGYWSDGISIYYLTSQGAASTTDFGLSSDATYDLYDASGHTVVDRWNNHFIISANRITEGFPEDWTTEELEFLSVIVASPYYGYILQLKTGSTRPYYNAIYSLAVKSIAPHKPVADALNITVEPIEPQFSNFIQNEPLGIL